MKKRTTIMLILAALLTACLSYAGADSWDIRLPASLTEIEESAFAGDTSLTGVYVGDGVQTIGARAFADSSLRYLRLPASITDFAADAFLNVPHVEIYGDCDPDFFAGMDNVSLSGAELETNKTTVVALAAGQEIWRTVPIDMTGKWYIGVENCSSAALYNSKGEKLEDLVFGEFAYYTYPAFSETENVQLCIRNDTDALIEAKVYIESPFQVMGLISKMQAEFKSGASIAGLYRPQMDCPLDILEANQYLAPSVRTTSDGNFSDYVIDMYVDDILVKRWEGTLEGERDEIHDFTLQPVDVMKFDGFATGEHTVRVEANGSVTEYTYSQIGARTPQTIGPEASSLYILPDHHVFATFTAESAGVYTIQSDIPYAMQIFGRLMDEDGNVLDSKEEDNEEYDFSLTTSLAEGQTVTLEAWLASQKEEEKPFYGVVEIIVGEPYAEGRDIFRNAQCRALVIGNTYATAPEMLTRLDGCRNDADSMASMLTGLAGSPYAVTKHIDLTAAEILSAIPAAFAGTTENDVSLFYYSGHGAQGSGSLVGNDAEFVSPEELKAALDKVPGTKIIMLDSCYSGYFIGRDPDAAGEQAAIDHIMSVFSWSSRGLSNEYFVLTASSQYETSFGYKGSTSLFTRNLLNGMGYSPSDASRTGNTPADFNQDGMFTLGELFVYCRREVRHTQLGQTICPWPYNSNQVLFIGEVPEQ